MGGCARPSVCGCVEGGCFEWVQAMAEHTIVRIHFTGPKRTDLCVEKAWIRKGWFDRSVFVGFKEHCHDEAFRSMIKDVRTYKMSSRLRLNCFVPHSKDDVIGADPSLAFDESTEYRVHSVYHFKYLTEESFEDIESIDVQKLYLRVSWEGYGMDHDSWEPYENVKNCMALYDFAKTRIFFAKDHLFMGWQELFMLVRMLPAGVFDKPLIQQMLKADYKQGFERLQLLVGSTWGHNPAQGDVTYKLNEALREIYMLRRERNKLRQERDVLISHIERI